NKQYVFYENQGMVATYDKLKVVEKKLKDYQGSRLAFSEITVDYLKDYRNYLLRDLGNSINTVHANFAKIRLIINNAIKEGVINGDKNPFRNFKLKWENTKKEFLTEDELYRIENLELNDKHVINHHRNMYVFAAYVGGLRISDLLLLQWKNVDSGIITLRIEKTQAQLSIKVPQKAMEILEFYRTNYKQSDNDFIFPILKNIDLSSKVSKVKAISSATAYANKNLRLIAKKAEINKRITFHTSRHTFATRALKKGIPITHVSKLMGHAQLRETMGYAKIVNEDLDKAMEVFDE
ncbi:MAG TPA: site-specific integrase, partial [Emticicia sp.]